jgi:c-di-GMP-binding flagellar brake protein YcgR
MQANTSANLRRWERQPTTIQISLVLKAEDDKVDISASVIDFSLCGVGVLTTLALVPGERIRIVAKAEFRHTILTHVVWVREAESSHWNYAGLEFLDISEA